MVLAILSLAGVLLAVYLYLHKIGLIGTLACGTGDCEAVQASSYSRFLGIDVPLLGVGGYGALLAVSLISLQHPEDPRWPRLLRGLALTGVLFSAYLTYIELFVLRAVCRWCLGSALIMLLILVASWMDRPAAEPRAG